jgi:tetratricopeptide (TPR) repeat protein
LRRYRLAARYSQEGLAAAAGLGSNTIADLERGISRFPHAHTVDALAETLHLAGPARATFTAAARRSGPSGAPTVEQRQRGDTGAGAPVFVGRANELATGARFLAGDGPSVLLFAGEPGIGKSRLLRELAVQARGTGWRVVAGGCDQRSGREPYAPFVETLEESLLAAPPSRRKGDLQECNWLARLGPELAERIRTPVPEWSLTPEQERRMIFAAVRRYLTNIAGPAGTLLVLDDVQWAGFDALDLLAFLVRTRAVGSPTDISPHAVLRVLGAYRTSEVQSGHPLENLLVDLAHDEGVSLHELARLSEGEARSLAMGLVGAVPDAEQQIAGVMARAEGVPFYLVNFAQALNRGADALSLSQTGDAGEREQKTPWLVMATIRKRIASLTPEAQDTLALAAIIGRVASLHLLRLALNHAEVQVAATLQTACRAQLLEESGSIAYRFTHDLIRETLLDSLGKARLALLHRTVADALERLPAPERQRQIAALADHLTQAGEAARALPYSLLAGDQAEAVYAHSEAERHYRAALKAAQDLGDPARDAEALAMEKLAMVLIRCARYQEALAMVEDSLLAYRALGDVEGEGRVAEGFCLTQYPLLSPDIGVMRLAALMEELVARGLSPVGQARLDAALAYLLVQWAFNSSTGEETASRCTEALAAAERGRERAQAAQDDGVRARALMSQALALTWLGRSEEGLNSFEELLPLAEAAHDLETYRMGLALAGYGRAIRGDFEQGQAHLDRALALSEHASDPFDAAFAWGNQAELAYYRGDWGLARSATERSLQIVRAYDLDARPFGTASQCLLSLLYLVAGEHEQADALSAEPLAIAKERRDLQQLRIAYGPIAERDLLAGRAAAARAELEPLLERPGLVEPQALHVSPYFAWALLDLGEEAEAAARATQSCQQARDGHYLIHLVDGLRVLAMVRLRQARWEEARALLEEAINLCRAMPYPYAEIKALYIYGQLHTDKGEPEQAREKYQAALAICERLGEGLYRPHIARDLRHLARG